MGNLYDFNHKPERWDIKRWDGPRTKAQKEQDVAEGRWTGPYGRRELQLAYTLAFTCLLRVDEVLKIKSQDIQVLDDEATKLTLPFRKTSQFGGEFPTWQPFIVLHFLQRYSHSFYMNFHQTWPIFALSAPTQTGSKLQKSMKGIYFES